MTRSRRLSQGASALSAFFLLVGPTAVTAQVRSGPSSRETDANVAGASTSSSPAATVTVPGPSGPVQIFGPPPPVAPAVLSRDEHGGATIRATRVSKPLKIDGKLDEPFYANTQPVTGFIQSVPDVGDKPSEKTEAWVGFDDNNVYISAKIYESKGDAGLVANEMRRDSPQNRLNDNFGVFLDTYYDRRNSVGFYENPLGGFSDLEITNEGNPNFDWNPVWESHTGRFDGGWTIEMAIPFKSLRYRPGKNQVWGIQMRRSIYRMNEWEHLTYLPLSVAGDGSRGVFRVSMYGTLVGLQAPPPSSNIEIKPYVISGLKTNLVTDPQVNNDGYADAGLDVKYGVTQNLTADFTYNTDFAQVEADEQQVNLTRFSLFFPEKRDFFLESKGIFNFAAGGISGAAAGGGFGGGDQPTLFYSRRIGLQNSSVVPILGGGRLTGKVGSFDVGLVDIQTKDAPSVGAASTNFGVLRLRRDVFSRSSIGVLYENRSRSTAAEALGTSGANQAWGVDGTFSLSENTSLLTYYSQTKTPGLDGLNESYRADLGYSADQLGASIDYLVVGDAFNPEIGFVRRKGMRETNLSGRWSPRTEQWQSIRQVSFGGDLGYITNQESGFVETRTRGVNAQIFFENSDAFTASWSQDYENFIKDERISRATIAAGRYQFQTVKLQYSLGPQRPYSGRLSVEHGTYYDGTINSFGLGSGRVELTPQLSFEPSLSFNLIKLPQGEFDQNVLVTRFTYTMTPRAFASALVQYNSGTRAFSTNVRLRWEWSPGSELFLVYTEDRNSDPILSPNQWSALQDRGFVIKVTKLFRM